MSWSNRFANLFRSGLLTREIDEELASHLEEAAASGRSSDDARRAFGSPLQYRERSRDLRLLPWLDSLRADIVFGWRQLRRNRAASLAAILSLGLAIGATTAAFRLVDDVQCAELWQRRRIDPVRQRFELDSHRGHPRFDRQQAGRQRRITADRRGTDRWRCHSTNACHQQA